MIHDIYAPHERHNTALGEGGNHQRGHLDGGLGRMPCGSMIVGESPGVVNVCRSERHSGGCTEDPDGSIPGAAYLRAIVARGANARRRKLAAGTLIFVRTRARDDAFSPFPKAGRRGALPQACTLMCSVLPAMKVARATGS